MIQIGVERVVDTMLVGLLCIINIELGIRRSRIRWR
jgi:hypothetical protein